MAGITTAYHILQESDASPSIVILDARELCSAATGRNGGHCKVKVSTLAGFASEFDRAIADEFQIYVHNIIDTLKKIVEEEELDCEFELRRSFDVHLDENESKTFKEVFDKDRKAGRSWTKSVSWIGRKDVEQLTSVKNAVSAFSMPACSLWPYKFVTQLLARLVSRYPKQLNVQTTTPVTEVTTTAEGASILSTSRGSLKCEKLVLATNAYTAGLLPNFKDVIIPIRGMASHIVPAEPVHPHLSNTYNIHFGPSASVDYFNSRPDGSIVVGGWTAPLRNDRQSWFDNCNDSYHFKPEIESYWQGYMVRNFLGWEKSDEALDRVWVGIMGITPDGWPHVGRVPAAEKQWMLAGFNGGGMAVILTVAKAVARMVNQDLGFEDVKEEFGLPGFFATTTDRLKPTSADEMLRRK